jgi:glycosyltransferase involved in cell wall biosynthesis
MKLSVVIPCYNERSTIEAVVEEVRSAPVEDVEIIVVDDGSTDGTRELLKGKPPGWVNKIVLQERNLGKGAALRTGFLRTGKKDRMARRCESCLCDC